MTTVESSSYTCRLEATLDFFLKKKSDEFARRNLKGVLVA